MHRPATQPFIAALAVLAGSLTIGVASAQDAAPASAALPMSTREAPMMSGWTLQFEPSVHYIAPAGDLKLPNRSSMNTKEVKVDDLNLDDTRLAPYAEIHFRRDKWRISLSGFAYSIDDRSAIADTSFQFGDLSIASGDRIESSLDFWTLEAVGSYRVFQDQTDRNSKGVIGGAVGIDILGGIRLFDVDLKVSTPTDSQSEDNLWAQPVLGARVEFAIWERFGFDVTTAFGYMPGDNTSFSWDIVAGFHWRPIENVGVQIGYQQLAFTLEDGDDEEKFRWKGGMAGLFGGVLIRF
ncbi:MAG: hypothetical protein KF705_14525 [Phycisphaeraceae bacterium]|nr:hypothetical protein [Phycisphaeraceae bacterium]